MGAGPAGVSTVAWLRSLHVPFTWVSEQVGGMLANVWSPVDNFPPHRYAHGIQIAQNLETFAHEIGAPQCVAVERIDRHDGLFWALDESWTHVVLATGTRARAWSAAGAADVAAVIRRSSSKAPAEFRGQDVAVLGGGDGAFEAAVRLADHSRVHLFFRTRARARPAYVEAAAAHDGIVLHPAEFPHRAQATPQGARLLTDTGEYDVAAVYPKLGFEAAFPSLGFEVSLYEGCLVVGDDGQSSVPGLYGVGDVTARPLRGVVTAMADGARTARALADAYESITDRTR